jgi:HEAT repeat protein
MGALLGLDGWEWVVQRGSFEVRSRRRKVVTTERFESGVLVIHVPGADADSIGSLEIHEGDRKQLLLSASRETLLQAGVYLAEIADWELTDGVSAESLLRSSLERTLLTGDKDGSGRLFSDARAVPALIQVWSRSSPGVRDRLIDLLKGLCESADHSADEDRTVSPAEALRQAFDHAEPAVRAGVLELLEHLEGVRFAPMLRTCLEDANLGVRRQAAASLCRLRDTASVPALCALTDCDDMKLRSTAISGLSEMGDPRAVAPLCHVLENAHQRDEAALRADAATGLGRLRATAAVPALSTALLDPFFLVRFAAAEALGRTGHATAISGLEAGIGDSDAEVRATVAQALGRIGTPEAGPGLLTLLHDRDPDVRVVAAEALGAAGIEASIPDLCRALDDPESAVRRESARALGRIALTDAGTAVALRAAIPALQRRAGKLTAEAADVKRACRVALERIEESTSGMKTLPLPAAAAAPAMDTLPVPHQTEATLQSRRGP